MPKLLFLAAEDWHFASHRLHLAIAARQAGFEVKLATRPGLKTATIEAAGIRVLPFAIDRRGMHPGRELTTLWHLVRLLRRERPDIVHAVALKPVVLAGLACRLLRIRRVVLAVTGMGFLFTGSGRRPAVTALVCRMLAWITRHGRVIVQNPDDAALLTRCGVASCRTRLIPGAGVDTERFTVYPEPNEVPVVLLPARLLRDKGVGEFASAAGQLKAEGVSARFVLVGTPDEGNPTAVPESELRRWVCEGRLEWWGQREDMPEVLARAHLVCLPSYREGLPKTLLEAMACGRAVVATDVPGCRDAVLAGVTGLLVPPGDAAALAEAVRELVENPERRIRMGEQGRQRVLELFSQERVAVETLAVYRELLL